MGREVNRVAPPPRVGTEGVCSCEWVREVVDWVDGVILVENVLGVGVVERDLDMQSKG